MPNHSQRTTASRPIRQRQIRIRPATASDLRAVTGLQQLPASVRLTGGRNASLRNLVLDHCVLVAEGDGEILAAAALDLERGLLGELLFANARRVRDLAGPLIARSEQLAVQFGFTRLDVLTAPEGASRLSPLGYAVMADPAKSARSIGVPPVVRLSRSLQHRQTRFAREVHGLCELLGIPADYGRKHRLSLQREAQQLSSIGRDVFDREQFLTPRASAAWLRMRTAAANAGTELQVVSAFRSVSYQGEIVQKKLNRGLGIPDILSVSAAPGYSEHHSGRALDITTPGFPHLEEAFEASPAFKWLARHAREFGFRLSFPRGNRHKLAYEPWHWCHAAD